MASSPADPETGLSPIGCLALLWPLLPETLVDAAARRALEKAAAALPPVPAIALELRLDGADSAIDLHQLVRADMRHLLPAHLTAHPPRSPAEARVHGFLAAWADGDAEAFSEAYLEWDRPTDPAAQPAPGLFLALGDGADDRAAHLDAAAARLYPADGGAAFRAAIERVQRVLPDGATINFLGFMLGRGDALRVNLRRLRPDELAPLLGAIGWPGDIAAAARQFADLVPLCDRVMVALDFVPELQPTLGFELFFDNGPASEPRHAALFERIAALGLCTPERRAALEGLDTELMPETHGQPWPAAWIVAAAARPNHQVPSLRVRLSHLKLSLDRHGRASAKAYVSVRHQWSPVAPITPALASVRRTASETRAAALAFLLREQGQDDLWRDFAIANGASDHWVTAVVGCALATSRDPRARQAAMRARAALLGARQAAQGWGYNGASPPDADSTAWVIRFLRTLDPQDSRAAEAEALLPRHLLAQGFATYAPGASIRFAGAPRDDSGWRGHHGCVAANAAGVATGPLSTALHDVLRATQRPDGAWQAYWWRTDILATALAMQALSHSPAQSDQALRRAAAWMREQEAATAFDLAWQALALRCGDAADQAAGRVLAERLVAEQRTDGGWPAGAEMLFPDPPCAERQADARVYPDRNRLLTSASALMALEAWQ